MTTLTPEHLHELCQTASEGPYVSLYLPSHEARQHPVAFKNLLREAERGLQAVGLTAKKAEALLAPGFSLLGDIWSLQGRNVAWFANSEQANLYTLDFPIEERLYVQSSFYVKPLFWLDLYSQLFYVLAISLKGARLLECTAAREKELELTNAPGGVESIRALEEAQNYSHAHASSRGGAATVHHGHGSRKELQKDILQYITQLAKALQKGQLAGRPMVLAGVDELTALYRKSHAIEEIPLVEGSIPGNPDETPPARLRERAFELVAPLLKSGRRDALARLAQSQGQHGASSVKIDEIVQAAYNAQVDALLLPSAMEVMGRIDSETRAITINSSLEDAVDILNECAVQTEAHGGKVHLFEPGTLPRPGAIFRW